MTRDQARCRVWKVLWTYLAKDLNAFDRVAGEPYWLTHHGSPEQRPLSKKDQERLKEAAKAIVDEIYDKANDL